ncbi:hypothetical protein TWF506_003729 [Arthrobotrys conoides]|uniref:F-box domain-containing protein n=1 Tax=Arthrobotrys conoides TaxID=74498 RepID=A0AAN8N7S3_9PEZI
MGTRSYLLSVPSEILRIILEFTLLVGNLPNVALTCRTLRPLATELLHKTITINISFSGFYIYQIESLLQSNHSGLKFLKDLRIQDQYNYDEGEYPEGISLDYVASFGRSVMEMHLRLLLRRLYIGQLREFHILTHREDAVKTIPNIFLSQLTGVKHLSLPGEVIRNSDWITDPKTTPKGLVSLRITNICSSQDFVRLWQILEKNVDSLGTLYLSSDFKHGEIIGMLLSLNSIDPVFHFDLKDLMPELLAMRTSLNLTNLQHLRIRGIPNLQAVRNISCDDLFNLHNLQTLRLDSCAAADDFLLEIGKHQLAPNLRSLQLFGSCYSATLNEVIPLLQPLETLYLRPHYKSYGATQEELSFSILDYHKGNLRRVWLEDPKVVTRSSDTVAAAGSSKLEIGNFPEVEELSALLENGNEFGSLDLPINTRLLRILDSFPPSRFGIDGLAEISLTVIKRHIGRLNGQKPALSVVSLGPYRPFLDTKAFISEDTRVKFLVKYDEDKDMGWCPVLTEVDTKEVEKKFPEFDIVHSERPEGPWRPV